MKQAYKKVSELLRIAHVALVAGWKEAALQVLNDALIYAKGMLGGTRKARTLRANIIQAIQALGGMVA